MRSLLISVSSLILLAHHVPVASTTSRPHQVECPTIEIETPSHIICPDAEVTFTASVTGGDINSQQTFNWTVSAGRIVSGQGTPTIRVATVNAPANRIEAGVSATVEIGDLTGQTVNCSKTASTTVQVSAFCPTRKFDEFGEVSEEGEMSRLDFFAIRLRDEPDTMGLIIMYAGESSPVGYSEARLERARKYLIEARGVEADRIVTKDAGSKAESTMEFWIMPTKLPPAMPSQTNNSNTLKPAVGP